MRQNVFIVAILVPISFVATAHAAGVRTDSHPEAIAARVTRIGTRAEHPPSYLATKEVHLTRAVPVRVTLDDTSTALAPGTPADVTFSAQAAPARGTTGP